MRSEQIVELVWNNLEKTGTSVGINKDSFTDWYRKLSEVSEGGETFLLTGLIYQQAPYLMEISSYLGDSDGGEEELSFAFNNVAENSEKSEKNYCTLRSIASILGEIEIDFTYDEELDRDTGIILYKFGADKELESLAIELLESIESSGAKKIITVDPYTTYALREIYPKFLDLNVEVTNYLELTSEKLRSDMLKEVSRKEEAITFHDPCVYARHLGIIDEPREILEEIGCILEEVKDFGEQTRCCGGPICFSDPLLSDEISKNRAEQLKEIDGRAITTCPICISKFRKIGYDIKDISELISASLKI